MYTNNLAIITIILINQWFQKIMSRDCVAIHINIPITHITIFDILVHILKQNLIIKFGESVAVYKTISATHVTIIEILITWR